MNNNKRKPIHITESVMRKIIKESLKQMITEIGDTHRGQYMLGRLAGRTPNTTSHAFDERTTPWNLQDDFADGYEDQRNIDNSEDSWKKSSAYDRMQNTYNTKAMVDNDEQQEDFIDWMLRTDTAMQDAVDFMKGYDKSALSNLFIQYEDALGYDLSDKSKENLQRALNSWWFYNEANFENY